VTVVLPHQYIANRTTTGNNFKDFISCRRLQLKEKDRHHIAALVQSNTYRGKAAAYCHVTMLCFCLSVTACTLKQAHQPYAMLQHQFWHTQAM